MSQKMWLQSLFDFSGVSRLMPSTLDAGEEDTMGDGETGGDDSMEEDKEDMEGDDGGEDSEGAQEETETEDSREDFINESNL